MEYVESRLRSNNIDEDSWHREVLQVKILQLSSKNTILRVSALSEPNLRMTGYMQY